MRPGKIDRDGQVQQEPIYIKFEDKIFKTDDKDIIEFIRKLKNFKADYVELEEGAPLPIDAGYQGNPVGIYKMENPSAPVAESSKEIDELKQQVSELTNLVKQILPDVQVAKKAGRPPKEPKEIILE